jgi:hypothetical protein
VTIPVSITATTPLELAALQAVLLSAEGNWFGTFVDDTMHFLYEGLGLENDDDGAMLDITELSNLMIRWQNELTVMVAHSKKVED